MLHSLVKYPSQPKLNSAKLGELFLELNEQNEESLLGGLGETDVVLSLAGTDFIQSRVSSSSSTASREYKGPTYCVGDPDGMQVPGCY